MSALSHSLNNPTLVLNKGWQPINVVPAHEAIIKVFSERAKIIDPSLDFQQFDWSDWSELRPKDGDPTVCTGGGMHFRIPEIILMRRYEKVHNRRVNFSRRELYKRDDYQCQYCGCRPGTKELNVDHIHPQSLGGESSWENCVLSCVDCNSKKADKTLKQLGWKLLKKPKKPMVRLYKGDPSRIPKSWEQLMGEAYWEVELQNNMKDD